MRLQIYTTDNISYLLEKLSDKLEKDPSYTKDDCMRFLRKMAVLIKRGRTK